MATAQPALRPAVLGVYADRNALEAAVTHLKQASFKQNEISVILPHQADDAPTSTGGATIGAGAGAVLGGVLGWLIGAGMLAIPGLGALVIAGPLTTALAGAASLGGVGGLVGSFAGLELSHEVARNYEARLKRGNPILSVQCDDVGRAEQARRILEETQAEDVYSQHFNSFTKEGAQSVS
jgi:hypothetical protein